jgi:RNA polymerase sigma-70 factor (ECF subfamily)
VEKEFTKNINSHIGILHKICNTYFFRNPNIEDYKQEILIRLWKAYPNFRNQSLFSTWMYRVALNSAIDIIRKLCGQPLFTELSNTELKMPIDEILTESDRKDRLYFAISQLNDIEKAITLLYLDDYSYDEIAEIIGLSKSNVGVKISRIKKQLVIKLNSHEGK